MSVLAVGEGIYAVGHGGVGLGVETAAVGPGMELDPVRIRVEILHRFQGEAYHSEPSDRVLPKQRSKREVVTHLGVFRTLAAAARSRAVFVLMESCRQYR